jgi:signal peptidase complex subunit 3
MLTAPNPYRATGRPHYYSNKREEYASIRFTLDADLSSLFTWNTKQLFVYVAAEWPAAGSENATNQAVIWDTVITSPSADHLMNVGPATMKKLRKSAEGKSIDPSRCASPFVPFVPSPLVFLSFPNFRSGKISLKNQRPKYQITHPSGKLAEIDDAVLKLHYNVQPWVGALTWNQENLDVGLWKRLKGGVSEKFAFPAVKKKKEGGEKAKV